MAKSKPKSDHTPMTSPSSSPSPSSVLNGPGPSESSVASTIDPKFDDHASELPDVSTEQPLIADAAESNPGPAVEQATEESKAVIDGWWVCTGAGHVEIVSSETEELAREIFCHMYTSCDSCKPMDRLPQAGNDCLVDCGNWNNGPEQKVERLCKRVPVNSVPDWIDRVRAKIAEGQN